nr:hypothetical protein [Polymorphobacter sp.]
MTLLLTALVMLAFAGVYAVLLAMLGSRTADLLAALLGRPARFQAAGGTTVPASRRFSRA